MGVLNDLAGKSLGAIGLKSVLNPSVDPPSDYGPDFLGLTVTEFVDGRPKSGAEGFGFSLQGNFMPVVPFSFGGTQEIVKEYYPGNAEPVVQVFGAREEDVTIKGTFKTKKFKDEDLRLAALAYQERVDEVRRRGNLVKIELGTWKRYGYLKECKFDLSRITRIEYSITFDIVGFKLPTNCKFVEDKDDDVQSKNKELIEKAANALALYQNYPSTMPLTISEFLDTQIALVASAINNVTDFIDDTLSDAESISRSAHRALGLIKNAQSTLSSTSRRIGALSFSVTSLGSGFSNPHKKIIATYESVKHINTVKSGFSSLLLLFAALRERYASIIATVPLKRHLVKDGDTLQRLAITYYNNAEQWKKIYDHNKLVSTQLVEATVLEIPRL